MSASADAPLLGRYRVIRRLGTGGMATVFLAEDERLGREVAVKRLHADSPEEMAQRLQREARVAASLNHPNIVAVYDVAADDEGVLMVMELVEGETLAAALRRGPLGIEGTLDVVRAVADALDHAHGAGVVHRDVKPGNVLLGTDGRVKLVDLGIAQAAELTRMTATGTALGTAAYMAPEQIEGRPVGPEADVYALATLAFEALSGRRARQGASPMEVAHRIATQPPPNLADAWPGAPPGAADALARGMSHAPAERQRTAGELADRLTVVLDAAPTLRAPAASTPRPRPGAYRSAPHRQRRGIPAWLLAVAAVAAVAVAVAVIAAAGGGGGGGGQQASDGGADPPAETAGGQESAPSEEAAPAEEAPAEEAPAAEPADVGALFAEDAGDPARGAELNSQGDTLIDQGNPEEAVPVLTEAVQSFPEGTDDLNYAFALFNLGQALRLSGRPDEAIPVLERRLEIPNQTSTVQQELDLAREEAAG
jgi:hypothetical protein